MSFDLNAYLTSLPARLAPLDPERIEQARLHLDDLTKPRGSAGRLEDIATQLYAILNGRIQLPLRSTLCVFAADHGVSQDGVSVYPTEVTAQMVLNYLQGGAAANVLARFAKADLNIVDVGVAFDFQGAAGLVDAKVRPGSRNLRTEAAMSNEELAAAIGAGVRMAEVAAAKGMQLVTAGEMGIGNTTAASAITAMLTGHTAAEVTGHGAGLDDAGKARKRQVIEEAIALHFGADRTASPLEILRCVGGLEIAAMAGYALEAAARKIAFLCDGFIATSAVAVASAIAPGIKPYLLAGHSSEEPGHQYLLALLGLSPILQLKMRLGEGTGAALAIPIVEASLRLFTEMSTFSSAGVSEKQA